MNCPNLTYATVDTVIFHDWGPHIFSVKYVNTIFASDVQGIEYIASPNIIVPVGNVAYCRNCSPRGNGCGLGDVEMIVLLLSIYPSLLVIVMTPIF